MQEEEEGGQIGGYGGEDERHSFVSCGSDEGSTDDEDGAVVERNHAGHRRHHLPHSRAPVFLQTLKSMKGASRMDCV